MSSSFYRGGGQSFLGGGSKILSFEIDPPPSSTPSPTLKKKNPAGVTVKTRKSKGRI